MLTFFKWSIILKLPSGSSPVSRYWFSRLALGRREVKLRRSHFAMVSIPRYGWADIPRPARACQRGGYDGVRSLSSRGAPFWGFHVQDFVLIYPALQKRTPLPEAVACTYSRTNLTILKSADRLSPSSRRGFRIFKAKRERKDFPSALAVIPQNLPRWRSSSWNATAFHCRNVDT